MRIGWLGALVLVAACGPKKGPEAPIVGWHQEAEAQGACWHPPQFDQFGPGDRRLRRMETMEAMVSQWRGDRGDGVSFDRDEIERMETTLLGRPELIESQSVENLRLCREAMGGAGTGAWARWVAQSPDRLTEGECRHPLIDTMYYHLDITREWQFRVGICEGEKVRVSGSTIDEFRIVDGGPWIKLDGDQSRPTIGSDFPCDLEGCYAGQLILRFTGTSGMVQVLPVGFQREFVAPEHGHIEVMINETTWTDNNYKIERGLQHRASVEYFPLD